MKKIIGIIVSILPVLGYGQTQTENYVKTTTYKVATLQSAQNSVPEDEKIEQVMYVDGLGRNKQSVAQRAGGSREDLITPVMYDGFGRQPKNYLSYPNPDLENAGKFLQNPVSPLTTYYDQKYDPNNANPLDINAYSEQRFEEAPRGRIIEQGAPGFDWAVDASSDADHTIKFEFDFNNVKEVSYYSVDFPSGNTDQPQLVANGYYSHRTLVKKVIKDENWQPGDGDSHTIHEFINKKGQILLKRTFVGSSVHDTYYIYDDYGNLTYVLSPEASENILDSNSVIDQGVLNNLGYQYKYDHRNRLIEKKIPGKGWEYIVYNKLDQPVLTQDAIQRTNDEWLFMKYDALGRVIMTGIRTSGADRATQQGWTDNLDSYEERTANPITVNGVPFYYTNNAMPDGTSYEVHTINYYDSYIDHSPTVVPITVLGQTVTSQVQGLPTVTKVRALGTSQWATTLTAYDEKGRVIYMDSYSEFLQSRDIIKTLLDFRGKALESETQHLKSGKPALIVKDYFTYDHMDRPLTHKQQIDNEEVELIASNTYDELGQLILKGVGGPTIVDGYIDVVDVVFGADGSISKANNNGGSWPAVAKTRGFIPSEMDGILDVIVAQDDRNVRFGLVETANGAQSNDYFDYGIYLNTNGTVSYVEGGTVAVAAGLTYEAGDLFRVERSGTNIKYYHKNNNFRTIPIGTSQREARLRAKVTFTGMAGSLTSLVMFGPLIDEKLQKIDYAYNIRGWLTDINDIEYTSAGGFGPSSYVDLFNFRINYNQTDANTGATPLYNGNIAQTLWKTENSDTKIRGYDFSYDDLNRLVAANGLRGSSFGALVPYNHQDLGEVTYDLNGNIMTLERRGANSTDTNSGLWDDLTYQYIGNRLIFVSDAASDPSYKDEGFYDGHTSQQAHDYTYDLNGNMTRDRNKGITNVSYNYLNLPETVSIANAQHTGTITYQYDAIGTKLKKTVSNGIQVIKEIEYLGDFMYEDGVLQYFSHPEGYIEPMETSSGGSEKNLGGPGGTSDYTDFKYVFQYVDHLGNIRVSYTDDNDDVFVDAGEIIEESNYYPFGLEQQGYNQTILPLGNDLAQKRKFNGMELGDELGLEWYDFGARNYDAAIGRWMNIDPLAEQMRRHSTYNYAFDNPVYYIDPDGMAPTGPKPPNKIVIRYNSYGVVEPTQTHTFDGSGNYTTDRGDRFYESYMWGTIQVPYHSHTIPTSGNSSLGLFQEKSIDKRGDYIKSYSVAIGEVKGQYFDSEGNKVSTIEEASIYQVTETTTTSTASFNRGGDIDDQVSVTTTTKTTNYDIVGNSSMDEHGGRQLTNALSNEETTMDNMNFDDMPDEFKEKAKSYAKSNKAIARARARSKGAQDAYTEMQQSYIHEQNARKVGGQKEN